MEYLLLICTDPEGEEPRPGDLTIEAWGADVDARGVWRHGNRLRPVEAATTVRRRGDDLLLTDGPFAETRETIGGYDVIECADLDEAIAVAAAHPMARAGRVEVRPVWPLGADD
ncbi:YciI family protein [Cellulomonas telluris]|uniref:YciI family protein n=1 Tax=Cellulomonas telluris TaxID=2306636 RepID=UPI0010A7B448|nr:YciI family protein [Cellulomonas telluris]